MPIRPKWREIILPLFAVAACASTPRFEPSMPLEEAHSLQEALLLCNQYSMPVPAERPVALKPFVSCLDQVAALFPDAGTNRFPVFHDELRLIYGTLRDANWAPRQGIAMETAIHAVLRALWASNGGEYTLTEKDLVLREFPRTSEALGVSRWRVSRAAALDPSLEALRAGLTALMQGPGEKRAARTPIESTRRTAELCDRLAHLSEEATYLTSLWKDGRAAAQVGSDSALSVSIQAKYTSRLQAAREQLEDLRVEIRASRELGEFRASACPGIGG